MKIVKKFVWLCLSLAALAAAGCGFDDLAIPQTVNVKASPTLVLPLGSVLGSVSGDATSFVGKFTDVTEIEKMLAGGTDTPFPGKLFLYKGFDGTESDPDGVQTFLLTYPLFDMNLDLKKYMESDVSVPPVAIPVPEAEGISANMIPDDAFEKNPVEITKDGGTDVNVDISQEVGGQTVTKTVTVHVPGTPVSAPLGDMEKLLTDIKLKNGVGVVLQGAGKWVKDGKSPIKMIVPQLGIGIEGTEADGNDDEWADGVRGTYTPATISEDGQTVDATWEASETGDDLAFINSGVGDNPPVLLDKSENGRFADTDHIKARVLVCGKVEWGITLNLHILFEWESAKLYPGESGKYDGKFSGLDLGSYLEELGGVRFSTIPTLLYMQGGEKGGENDGNYLSDLTIKLQKSKENSGTDATGFPTDFEDIDAIEGASDNPTLKATLRLGDADTLASRTFPQWNGDDGNGAPGIQDDEVAYLARDFVDVLNEGSSLRYEITLDEGNDGVEITSESLENLVDGIRVSATLVIALPLKFNIASTDSTYTPAEDEEFAENTFRPINLKMLDDLTGNTGTGGTSALDDVNEMLEEYGGKFSDLKLTMTDIKNDLISGVYLGIGKPVANGEDPKYDLILFGKDSDGNDPPPKTFDLLEMGLKDLAKLPDIKLFVEEDETSEGGGESTATFTVPYTSPEDDPQFDFSLTITAGVDVDYSKDL